MPLPAFALSYRDYLQNALGTNSSENASQPMSESEWNSLSPDQQWGFLGFGSGGVQVGANDPRYQALSTAFGGGDNNQVLVMPGTFDPANVNNRGVTRFTDPSHVGQGDGYYATPSSNATPAAQNQGGWSDREWALNTALLFAGGYFGAGALGGEGAMGGVDLGVGGGLDPETIALASGASPGAAAGTAGTAGTVAGGAAGAGGGTAGTVGAGTAGAGAAGGATAVGGGAAAGGGTAGTVAGGAAAGGGAVAAGDVAGGAAGGTAGGGVNWGQIIQSALGMGSGISGLVGRNGGATAYVPQWQAGADQMWQNLMHGAGDAYGAQRDALLPFLQNSFRAGSAEVPGVQGRMRDIANIDIDQANNLFTAGDQLRTSGRDLWTTANDPQGALRARMLGETQEQSRASSSLRGIGMGAQAAGLENEAVSNFGMNWEDRQLARQEAGLRGMTGAYNTAGMNTQAGVSDLTSAAQMNIGALSLPFDFANSYSGAMNNGIYNPAFGMMGNLASYLGLGQSGGNNAFNQGQTNLNNLTTGLGQFGNAGGWGALSRFFGGGGGGGGGSDGGVGNWDNWTTG